MSLSVIDASAIVAFLAFDDPRGSRVGARLRTGDAFYAPTILDYEVLGALRGLARKDDRLNDSYVEECIRDLELLPVRREDVAPLRRRIWGLRHNLTVYDAAYVALAEKLNATLVTCDEKFARSAGVGCRIETIS
ncbi:MAG: type II toxin-antitoxin system VapC family toxin [Streptosporangiaceae bacterium]